MLGSLLHYDPRILAALYGSLFFCASIGCWIATWRIRRPSRFRRTFARGILGGVVGGFFHPIYLMVVGYSLFSGEKFSLMWHVEGLLTWLTLAAALSVPLAILIAVRKGRQQPIGPG